MDTSAQFVVFVAFCLSPKLRQQYESAKCAERLSVRYVLQHVPTNGSEIFVLRGRKNILHKRFFLCFSNFNYTFVVVYSRFKSSLNSDHPSNFLTKLSKMSDSQVWFESSVSVSFFGQIEVSVDQKVSRRCPMHKYVAIVQEGGDKTTATNKIFCHIKHFLSPTVFPSRLALLQPASGLMAFG